MNSICLNCGIPFEPHKGRGRKAKFHSSKCRSNYFNKNQRKFKFDKCIQLLNSLDVPEINEPIPEQEYFKMARASGFKWDSDIKEWVK